MTGGGKKFRTNDQIKTKHNPTIALSVIIAIVFVLACPLLMRETHRSVFSVMVDSNTTLS